MDENKIPKNNILIIEDEQDIREIYVEVLTNAKYTVDQAADGETGMQKIKEGNWDLLLLDIMLPGRDGLKILKEIKETPGLKKGPVIALTNLNSENIIHEVFTSGADGYLIKSEITPDKVVEEIAKVLSKEEEENK
ncbi:MAG: response regulator [Patescibacteria group bacterium]|nr:response regulator [Patescibacteria group bacterium]MBU1952775.1 response regulator [Patescibacteria group bacterium]